jgi:hypothetical protein
VEAVRIGFNPMFSGRSQAARYGFPGPHNELILGISETFLRLVTLILGAGHHLRAFNAASNSSRRSSFVKLGSKNREIRGRKSVLTVFGTTL